MMKCPWQLMTMQKGRSCLPEERLMLLFTEAPEDDASDNQEIYQSQFDTMITYNVRHVQRGSSLACNEKLNY